jgi:uncharacterized membrane protein
LFGHVVDYSPKLIWLNLVFLLSIVLMPFSTGAFGEYSTPATIHLKTPLIIYVANICFTGAMMFWLLAFVGNPSNALLDGSTDPVVIRDAKRRAALVPAIFALTIPVAFWDAYVARYVPILIPIILRLARWRTKVRTQARIQSVVN